MLDMNLKKSFYSLFACFAIFFSTSVLNEAKAVEHYIMALYYCPECNKYKDQCDAYPYAQCSVSQQEFCREVCGGGGGQQ